MNKVGAPQNISNQDYCKGLYKHDTKKPYQDPIYEDQLNLLSSD